MKSSTRLFFVLVLIFVVSQSLYADIINGDFQWTTWPPGGKAFLEGWNLDGDNYAEATCGIEISGGQPTGLNLSCYAHAANSLGLHSRRVTIKLTQNFSALAGQSLKFDYKVNTLSTELGGTYSYAAASFIADVYDNTGQYSHEWSASGITDGWTSFEFPPLPTDGDYTVKFSVIADATADHPLSQYALSDVNVSINHVSVPEPSTLALLGMGAFGLLAWGWERTRRRQEQ